MAAGGEWASEPVFGDALSGSGGTADPSQPPWSAGLPVGDVFPDALAALPLVGAAPGASSPAPDAQNSIAPRPVAPARRPPPPPDGRFPPTADRPSPSPSNSRSGPTPGSTRPWSQFPPPGQPAAQYVPVPTSAQLAPAPGRRPSAGLGYNRGPGPTPAAAPGGLVRPPAYLPKNQGAVQLRAALERARQRSTRLPGAAGGSKKSRASGLWSALVFLVVVLVPSGLGRQIITGISEVFKRR